MKHVVEQGETCAHVAALYGLREQTLWTHADNQALKQQRKNPNVLLPGDVLNIPDAGHRTAAAGTDQRHRFRRKGVPLKVRLSLRDASGVALAGQTCELRVGERVLSLQSKDDGTVEADLPLDVQALELTHAGATIALQVGHLDPVDEMTGWRARLNNLGYQPGTSDDPECEQRRFALEEFQCDQGLTVDGICGPKTQARLIEVHGC